MDKKTLIHFDSLDSTNKYLKNNFKKLEDKTVVSAAVQTKGKGRFDRVWVSSVEGNAYFSILLKPNCSINDLPLANYTQFASVKLCEYFENLGINANIKWPNDILVDGKKFVGILSEVVIVENIVKALIIGIGVNLNMPEEIIKTIEKPATSINLLLDKKLEAKEFIEKFTDKFFDELDEFTKEKFSLIKQRYEKRCNFLGKEITIKNLDKELTGIARKINIDGSLSLEMEKSTESIYVGDIL